MSVYVEQRRKNVEGKVEGERRREGEEDSDVVLRVHQSSWR